MKQLFSSPRALAPSWLARLTLLTLPLGLTACALTTPTPLHPEQLAALQGAQIVLLGEQHDAPDHQRIERELVQALIAQKKLAALALEMAPQGGTTAALHPSASEEEVRLALQWVEKEWPWEKYNGAVMAAVRTGVPVLGANLPKNQVRAAMTQRELDLQLKGPALKAQQQAIRIGHCNQLPESQISPMTRAQIARDIAMAQTLTHVLTQKLGTASSTGQLVLLLAGAQHADRSLGVPQHLSSDFQTLSIGLVAREEAQSAELLTKFHRLWPAEPASVQDYCADFKAL